MDGSPSMCVCVCVCTQICVHTESFVDMFTGVVNSNYCLGQRGFKFIVNLMYILNVLCTKANSM